MKMSVLEGLPITFRNILDNFLCYPHSSGPLWSIRNVSPHHVPLEVMRSYATFVYLTDPRWVSHPEEKKKAEPLLKAAIAELTAWADKQKKE